MPSKLEKMQMKRFVEVN